jgi:hypothetical protein
MQSVCSNTIHLLNLLDLLAEELGVEREVGRRGSKFLLAK